MRKIISMCLSLIVATVAMAQTVPPTEDGWQKISAMPTNPADYYYVFSSSDDNLMLALEQGNHQGTNKMGVYYQTACDPKTDLGKVWVIIDNEADNGKYSIRNVEFNGYFLQTEWEAAYYIHTSDQASGKVTWNAWGIYTIDDLWVIENRYPNNFVGPWDAANFNNGAECAGNKTGDDVGHFNLYAILRSDFHAAYASTMGDALSLDMTAFIRNADFEAHSQAVAPEYGSGWDGVGTNKARSFVNQSGNGNFTGHFMEMWGAIAEATLSQNLGVLPAGKYDLSLCINSGNSTTVFVKSGTEDVATKAVQQSAGPATLNFKLTNPTDVTIGVRSSASSSTQWVAVDDFTLKYYGAPSFENLQIKLDVANTLLNSTDIRSAESQAALSAAITNGQNVVDNQDEDGMEAAIDAIDNAIDAVKASIVAYEAARASLATALERFEKDYNDGANGALRKMSTERWNTLLEAVKTASLAKDYQDAAGNQISVDAMNTAARALQTAMNDSEPSIAIYKSPL